MEPEKIEKNIPKEIYDDIMELAEKAFLAGIDEFTADFLPSDMKNLSEETWDMLYEKRIIYRYSDKIIQFSSLDLEIYLAVKKMVKINNYTVFDIENELDEDWYEKDKFVEKKCDILHLIAKFNQKKFNEEYLIVIFKNFIDSIDDSNEETIAASMLKSMFLELSFGNDLNSIGTFGYSTYIEDCLRYVGIDLLQVLENINFKKYEIIIKNRYFKEFKIQNKKYDRYIINLEKMLDDDYFMEILKDNGVIDILNMIYKSIFNMINEIERESNVDYYRN